VQWKVEGLFKEEGKLGDGWKLLVMQDTDYDTPEDRKCKVKDWFCVEYWRTVIRDDQKGMAVSVDKVVDLTSNAAEVKARLGFFLHTIPRLIGRRIHGKKNPYAVELCDRLDECHIGKLPMLSQIIPVYAETVILTEKDLKESDGVNTNLGFICSQYPEEWDIFAQKNAGKLAAALEEPTRILNISLELYLAFCDGKLNQRALDDAMSPSVRRLAAELTMEIRMWGSMRSQTVSRTVVGAVNYHEILATLEPMTAWGLDPVGAIQTDAINHCVELVIAHQTYGKKAATDADVNFLLSRYQSYPVFVVFDYDHETMSSDVQKKVHDFIKKQHGYEGSIKYASVRAQYKQMENLIDKEKLQAEHQHELPFYSIQELRYLSHHDLHKHAEHLDKALKEGFRPSTSRPHHEKSPWGTIEWICEAQSMTNPPVTAKCDRPDVPGYEILEIIEVLPRTWPLLVGSGKFRTQGKAGNQLGALRFARGHFMQMMDCNMGAFLGEAAKTPFIVRRFQPQTTSRTCVEARIIGFREAIFTEAHGTVGSIMASAEWSFGTICQRFLKGLGMRMHYGHPDFIDGFWASNRGSLSKASPAINLSEDIFAGFNVAMRSEISSHVDSLCWEKGRESSFNAAALFFTKVSKGNVGVMRSRDLKFIAENQNVKDNFSFYFASIGFYLNNVLIDYSISVYVVIFVMLTLASKTLEEVVQLDAMLASEWIVSLGTVTMLPRLAELMLEYGAWGGAAKFVPSIPGNMMLFTFINKSIASGLKETMLTGEAAYIATGRPNANTHYSWRECYFLWIETHYYPALSVWGFYLLYTFLVAGYETSSIPMVIVMFTVTLWIVAPILFCPQPTTTTFTKDMTEFLKFCVATPPTGVRPTNVKGVPKPTEDRLKTGLKDPDSTLYEFWLKKNLEQKRLSLSTRLLLLLFNAVKYGAALSVVYSSMTDYIWNMVVLLFIHVILMELWRICGRHPVFMAISLLMWLVTPFVCWPETTVVEFMISGSILYLFLQLVKDVILLICWFVYSMEYNFEWKEDEDDPLHPDDKKRIEMEAAYKVIAYDEWAEALFVNFLEHLVHVFMALCVLVMDAIVQIFCIALESCGGLHSTLVLNRNLAEGTGCCQRRLAYEPGSEAATVGMSEGRTERAQSLRWSVAVPRSSIQGLADVDNSRWMKEDGSISGLHQRLIAGDGSRRKSGGAARNVTEVEMVENQDQPEQSEPGHWSYNAHASLKSADNSFLDTGSASHS